MTLLSSTLHSSNGHLNVIHAGLSHTAQAKAASNGSFELNEVILVQLNDEVGVLNHYRNEKLEQRRERRLGGVSRPVSTRLSVFRSNCVFHVALRRRFGFQCTAALILLIGASIATAL